MRLVPKRKLDLIFCSFLLIVSGFMCWLKFDPDVVLNTTTSMPVGIYHRINDCCRTSQIVMLRPFNLLNRDEYSQGAANGYFSRNAHLQKRIVAMAGDRVVSNTEGVSVNGTFLKGSAPILEDGNGRKIKRITGRWILKENEFFVLGESPESFDSRYFGIISRRDIVTAVVPLLTFDL